MVVCRYFQQGNCRFGDRCRFEHPNNTGYSNQGNYNSNNAYKWYGGGYRGGDNGGSNRGVTFRDTFSTNNRFAALSPQDDKQGRAKAGSGLLSLTSQDILNTISADMDLWERSHTWLFSCYSYFKDGSCLPGFDDISPEELRLEAYEAEKSGNGQLYLQKVKDLVNRFRQIKSDISRPSMQTKQKLIQIIEEDRKRVERGAPASSTVSSGLFTSSTLNQGSGFGQTSWSSGDDGLFGGAQSTSNNLFGKPAQPSSSLFGNTQSGTNLFGNSQSGTNLFGNTQSGTGLFGTSQSAGNLFGNTQAGGVFGSSQSSGNMFGSAQSGASVFGNSQSGASVFGGSTINQSQGSVFSNNQTGNALFGSGTTEQKTGFGVAEVQSTGSVFGNTAAASVPNFGAASSSPATGALQVGGSTGGATPFGASGPTPGGVTPAQAPSNAASGTAKSSIYTPLTDLTAEEKQQFEAVVFTAGKLPTRPPPKELC